MNTRLFFSLILFLFLIPFAWSDQLIIEPDMQRQPIIDAITQANHSIQLVMYGFTDKKLLNVLLKKKSQGKTIKIILEKNPYKAKTENKKTIKKLNAKKISWQGDVPPFKLIHQKTLIIDNQKAIVMTFNFTRSAFKNERNFALVIDDAARVQAISKIFSADFNHVAYVNNENNIIVSPDDSRNKLIHLVQQAKSSIKIYAQQINDYQFLGALAKAARHNVTIKILTSTRMPKKQYRYLINAGVIIHYEKKLYIHAKVLIIDNQKAVVGSINFTRSSLDNNRELSVITYDSHVIKQLSDTFNQDWKLI